MRPRALRAKLNALRDKVNPDATIPRWIAPAVGATFLGLMLAAIFTQAWWGVYAVGTVFFSMMFVLCWLAQQGSLMAVFGLWALAEACIGLKYLMPGAETTLSLLAWPCMGLALLISARYFWQERQAKRASHTAQL